MVVVCDSSVGPTPILAPSLVLVAYMPLDPEIGRNKAPLHGLMRGGNGTWPRPDIVDFVRVPVSGDPEVTQEMVLPTGYSASK